MREIQREIINTIIHAISVGITDEDCSRKAWAKPVNIFLEIRESVAIRITTGPIHPGSGLGI